MRKPLVALSLSLAASWAAAQVTLPYTFKPGMPAKAAEINADLQALATAINGLNARVQKLEGTITAADLAGTYAVNQFQTEIGGNPGARVAAYTGRGTLTLAANGTGTLKGNTEVGSQLNLPSLSRSTRNHPQPQESFKWSYASGALTIWGMPATVVAGGRLLVITTAGTDDGTNAIVLLTRLK
ncbi:hypothetical protein [Azohydromonas aeria]|uniref:hypothetical protein n=1 Tax=Azohydromonas aeria TaxID=2590212 RepID=UPI0012FB6DA9|nr:hypothetical protein [Azohydromonas aeria]